MAQITIICHVDDRHLGTGPTAPSEYAQRLDGELMKMESNSECGLQVSQCLIDGENLYSDKFVARSQLKARADIEFVWYDDDHAYVQWTNKSSVRGMGQIKSYLRGTGLILGECTGPNQISIATEISLDFLQSIADMLDITLFDES
jgi:hypothetical protein